MASSLQTKSRNTPSSLLSLTYPSKALFHRQFALLRAETQSELDDEVDTRLNNIREHLIEHKESTFFMRVAGDSMRDLSILDGDLLVVDRAMPATNGSVVIAVINGEFSVKQLIYSESGRLLRAAHPDYADLMIESEPNLSIWGVVQWNVHKTQIQN